MNQRFRPDPSGTAAVSIPIEGMTCASCVRHVEEAIRAVPGVASASVNLATERADIAFAGAADLGRVASAVADAGYAVPRRTTALAVEGMTCASCVAHVEKALLAVPGVSAAAVNLATERATVEHVAGLPQAALEAAVRAAGYEVRPAATPSAPADDATTRKAQATAELGRDAIAAAALTVPVVILEMGTHLFPSFHMWLAGMLGGDGAAILQLALTSVVLFGPGFRFFRRGVPALLRLAPDMNSLVAIGTAAAYGYSAVATFLPWLLPAGTAGLYFEAAAVIVTLVLTGRYLEARAKGRTSDAIRRISALAPQTAAVRRDGRLIEVPVAEVRAGDILEVRPGQRIPVDGVVVEGGSLVDQAMLTGEPMPVWKEAGAEVVGGTLVQSGAFSFRATRVGADTMLAHIVRTVEAAQGSKLPVQALVDRITAVFVPVVLAVAALTFLAWLSLGPEPSLGLALVNAVAVLIIACPCALGLATPISIMVGTGRGAELGILFRNGAALQALASIAVVALDKTGTVTSGKPSLVSLEAVPPFTTAEILAVAAAVEARSEHPIAAAILSAAKEHGVRIESGEGFEAHAGFGATATVGGRSVAIGAARLMHDAGIDIGPLATAVARVTDTGATPVWIAIDRQLAGLVAVRDTTKPTSPAAVDLLRQTGIAVALVTGDDRRAAAAVAREVGIDEVLAELTPTGKVAAVRDLRAPGRPVAFVGDGINDAPALAEADVGIAVGTGTDIAMESADIVLVTGDLRAVADAVTLSRAALRNIRQNLFWAFAYNVALIPVAAGVLYPVAGILLSPIVAAGAMALSSVFVVTNALRLRGFAGHRAGKPAAALALQSAIPEVSP